MTRLQVDVDATAAWPDLVRRDTRHGLWTRLGAIPPPDAAGPTDVGQLRIAIVVELDDGRPVFADTSWAQLAQAVDALERAYGRAGP